MRRKIRPAGVVLALAGVLAAVGCGGDTVTLTGNVTVGGQPLESGTVIARGATGQVVYGVVQAGKYEVPNVPAGQVKLAVVDVSGAGGAAAGGGAGRGAPAPGKAGGANAATSKSKIPPDYQDPDKTPVTHDTNSGRSKDIVIP